MEDEDYLEKLETEVDDLKIAFISTNDFIKNKQAIGKAKDLGDIESLKKAVKKVVKKKPRT